MLSSSAALAKKLVYVIEELGVSQVKIAARCNVSKQAVQGWKKTGRIDKRHLPALSELSEIPLPWWLDPSQTTYMKPQEQPSDAPVAMEPQRQYRNPPWPFLSVSVEQYGTLSDHQKSMVEGFIRALALESHSGKSDPTAHAA